MGVNSEETTPKVKKNSIVEDGTFNRTLVASRRDTHHYRAKSDQE